MATATATVEENRRCGDEPVVEKTTKMGQTTTCNGVDMRSLSLESIMSLTN